MRSTLIVGLSGVTNGGKSSLAQTLLQLLPGATQLLKQDDYYLPEDSPLHVPCPGDIKHHNWEAISSLDMDQMVQDINLIAASPHTGVDVKEGVKHEAFSSLQSVKTSLSTLSREQCRRILLLDGFTLFDDARLRDLCELKFFLTLPKGECLARRQLRSYEPPDPPGYFEACVWPMYKAHLKNVERVGGVRFCDGTGQKERILAQVLEQIASAAVL